MNNVCTLIVTYNRKIYLEKLLKNITKNKNVKNILIFDNFSNDGTTELLKEMKIIDEVKENEIISNKKENVQYYYYRNNKNTGGAGGFHKGFELIQNMKKFDFIWLMDDDVLPDENCLNNLLKYQSEDTMITIPNRTDENFNDNVFVSIDLTNPFKLFANKKKCFKASKLKDDKEYYDVINMTFEGPLINCKLIDIIGLPDEKYFIQYDDTDYAMRAIKYTKIKFIKKAILHKQIVNNNKPQRNKKRYMNWKDYYAYRNDILFCRKYGKNIFVKYITPIFLCMNLILRAIIKRKWKNIKVIKKAFLDGYSEKGGKIVNPGEF